MTDLDAAAATDARSPRSRARWAAIIGAAILCGLVGYVLGSSHSGTRFVTGPLEVGDHVATMTDTGYGISGSIPWIDAQGTFYERGWPDCVGPAAQDVKPVVTFAVTRVDYPGGPRDQVVYVDCRH
jgi:hypothetical protein